MTPGLTVKLDLTQVKRLQTSVRRRLTRSQRLRQGFIAAGNEYLRINEQIYLQNAKGGRQWKEISFLAVLLRKRNVGKYSTLEELTTAASALPILSDTFSLLRSFKIIKANSYEVEVGSRDSRAEKHQFGRQSSWPSESTLLAGLNRNFQKYGKGSIVRKSRTKSKRQRTRGGKGTRRAKKIKEQLNPDYVALKAIIKRLAGKVFKLPVRPVLFLPNKGQMEQILRPVRKAYDQEFNE